LNILGDCDVYTGEDVSERMANKMVLSSGRMVPFANHELYGRMKRGFE
jgi:hypothetical protein